MGMYMLQVTYNSTTEKFEAAWVRCPIPTNMPAGPGNYFLEKSSGGGYYWTPYTSPVPTLPANPESYGASSQNFVLAHEGAAWSWEHLGIDFDTAEYVPANHYAKLYFSQNSGDMRTIEFEDGGAG